jgi:hypothetical protein
VLGGDLHRSAPVEATAMLRFIRCFDVIFFKPMGHYVRDIYSY